MCVTAYFSVCVLSRKQQGRGGGHDAGVVHVGKQEERSHQKTEPALSAVCILSSCPFLWSNERIFYDWKQLGGLY